MPLAGGLGRLTEDESLCDDITQIQNTNSPRSNHFRIAHGLVTWALCDLPEDGMSRR